MDRSFFSNDELPGENGSSEELPPVPCLTYIWDQAINDLAAEAWCYDQFVENSLNQYL
jgi:hypothetical protein